MVTVEVPWARPGSGFTLLFEAFAMALIEREMPVNRVAEVLGVNPQRVWSVFNHWIEKARQVDDPSSITQLGVDETSSRKGHKYVTLGVDMTTAARHSCVRGQRQSTLKNIRQHLEEKGVPKEEITQLSMDLSPAFIAGAAESFPTVKVAMPLPPSPLTGSQKTAPAFSALPPSLAVACCQITQRAQARLNGQY